MNAKIGKVAGRSAIIGLLLAVLLVLLVAWSVMADNPAASASGILVQYRIDLAGQVDRLEVAIPKGFEYVGLAPGSQVGTEPKLSDDGSRAVWHGPFSGTEELRFWLAPQGSMVAPATLPVIGAGVEAKLAEPVTTSPSGHKNLTPTSALTGTITITKTVNPAVITREDSRWVTYQVVFTHSTTDVVTLNRITDTLPADFLFGGMAVTSDIVAAPSINDNVLVWDTTAYSSAATFTDTLTIGYNVRSVDRSGEYQNSVVVLAGGETFGPASATLRIEGNLYILPAVFRNYEHPRPIWQIAKTPSSTEVESGEEVNYTVLIKNVGNLTGTLSKIEDALPSEFTFLTMMPGSGVTTAPSGTTGTIYWTGNWNLAPGEGLVLVYKVKTGGGGDKVNTITLYNHGGQAVGTGTGTVTVGGGLPYEDTFDTVGSNNQPVDWQPFTNWPGLSADRWFAASGIYVYDYTRVLPEWTSYDLSMYRAAGSEGWTDYRIETKIKDSKTVNTKQGLSGVWLRGTYQNSGAGDGKTVGGYYVLMKPADDRIYLGRIKADDPSFRSYDIVASYLYGPRIGHKHWYDLFIQVEGSRIQVWFGDQQDGVVKAIDWTDPNNTWPNGSVGFATYYTIAAYDYIRVLPITE